MIKQATALLSQKDNGRRCWPGIDVGTADPGCAEARAFTPVAAI